MFDKVTYNLLKNFYKAGSLTFEQISEITNKNEKDARSANIAMLYTKHFISFWETSECINDVKDKKQIGYSITLEGAAYVEQKRRELLNFWVPYTITTIVAIASLLVAIAGFLRDAQPVENQGISDASHTQAQPADQSVAGK